MNKIEYIQREVAKNLVWKGTHYIPKAKAPSFMIGWSFTEEEYDRFLDGGLKLDEVKAVANFLEAALIESGRAYMADWHVDMTKYKTFVDFDFVTCTITHDSNGATIVLSEVFFSVETGEILQALLGF